MSAKQQWGMRGMRRIAFCAAWLAAGGAAAADQAPTRFSISPFVGYRDGGSFVGAASGNTLELGDAQSHGLAINIRATAETEVELLWSRQSTALEADEPAAGPPPDLRIDYFHVGGTYLFPASGIQPFFVGSIGATVFDPAEEGYDSETKLSFGAGAGIRVPVTRNLGLRFEVRGYGTVLSNDSAALCANGRCLVSTDGTLLWQYEANAGVYLAF